MPRGYINDVLKRVRDRIDRFQRSHKGTAFMYGVVKKFGEDRAGQQAALLAYYGFFSIFPLLLVGVTVLGIVLKNNPKLQAKLLSSALAQFPIIGDQIQQNIHAMSKVGAGLIIGIAGALWGGLGGLKALQNAMDHVWSIPVRKQANTIRQIVHALMMLGFLGVFAVASTAMAGSPFTIAGGLALNIVIFLVVFKLMTVADVSWRDVAPGAIVAGVAWTVLQGIGNFYVARTLKGASELYGFFGIVIGLLSWMYLGAQVTLYAAEVNVVKKFRAWPRSMSNENLTDADRKILAIEAKKEERVPPEQVEVRFDDQGRKGA